MKITFEQCTVSADEVHMVIKCVATFKDLAKESDAYTYKSLKTKVADVIAQTIAAEVMAEHKMDIVNRLSHDDIVTAIQLKIIEGFSLNRGGQ